MRCWGHPLPQAHFRNLCRFSAFVRLSWASAFEEPSSTWPSSPWSQTMDTTNPSWIVVWPSPPQRVPERRMTIWKRENSGQMAKHPVGHWKGQKQVQTGKTAESVSRVRNFPSNGHVQTYDGNDGEHFDKLCDIVTLDREISVELFSCYLLLCKSMKGILTACRQSSLSSLCKSSKSPSSNLNSENAFSILPSGKLRRGELVRDMSAS